MFNFSIRFTDKQSYLEWVASWKEQYKQISKELRDLRIELSKPHKLRVKNIGYWGNVTISEAAPLQSKQRQLQERATSMLWWRQHGKEESWAMKQSQVSNV